MKLPFNPYEEFNLGHPCTKTPILVGPLLHFMHVGRRAWQLGNWNSIEEYYDCANVKDEFVDYCTKKQESVLASAKELEIAQASARQVDWLDTGFKEELYKSFLTEFLDPLLPEDRKKDLPHHVFVAQMKIFSPARLYWARAIECIGLACQAADANDTSQLVSSAVEAGESLRWGIGCMLLSAEQFHSLSDMERSRELVLSDNAKMAANARHSQPGGYGDKRMKILEAWSSGKYASREECAEKEHAAAGISFSTARKTLRGVPNPT